MVLPAWMQQLNMWKTQCMNNQHAAESCVNTVAVQQKIAGSQLMVLREHETLEMEKSNILIADEIRERD